MDEKQIILIPGKPPKFVGSWTLGEVRQMAQSLLVWLDNLPLVVETPQQSETESLNR